MLELADKDIKIIITPVFGMSQNVSRDLKDMTKTQNGLTEIKNYNIWDEKYCMGLMAD